MSTSKRSRWVSSSIKRKKTVSSSVDTLTNQYSGHRAIWKIISQSNTCISLWAWYLILRVPREDHPFGRASGGGRGWTSGSGLGFSFTWPEVQNGDRNRKSLFLLLMYSRMDNPNYCEILLDLIGHFEIRNPVHERDFKVRCFEIHFPFDGCWNLVRISLTFVPKGPINNKPALAQISKPIVTDMYVIIQRQKVRITSLSNGNTTLKWNLRWHWIQTCDNVISMLYYKASFWHPCSRWWLEERRSTPTMCSLLCHLTRPTSGKGRYGPCVGNTGHGLTPHLWRGTFIMS